MLNIHTITARHLLGLVDLVAECSRYAVLIDEKLPPT
jgi:hypothetical protein